MTIVDKVGEKAPLVRPGIWPAVLIETMPDGNIDFDVMEASVRRFARGGVHGVYTGDTASEFYTLEHDEWNELATRFREVTRRANIPAGIGCTWTNQQGILRRVQRARELGFDNIHLSQPYWIRLNEASQKIFWEAVGEVAGSLPVIVYAGSQGQFPIDGYSICKLREYCPAIAGTKQTGFDAVVTNSLLALCPELQHFVGEQVLTGWVAQGAAGCPSNLAGFCPEFVVRWYDLMAAQQWQSAFDVQRRVNAFYEEGGVPIRKAGYMLDKPLAELSGAPGVSRKLRAPYAAASQELFENLKAAALRHLPECFEINDAMQ